MYLPQIAGRTHPDSVGTQARRPRSGAATTTSRRRSARTASCSRSSRSRESVQHRPVRRRRARPARSSRSSAVRRATRTSTRSASSTRRATGRRTATSSRSSSTPKATTRSRSSTRSRRTSSAASSCRAIGAVSHVSWSPDGRTLAFSGQARRHQRSVPARPRRAATIRQLTNDKYADIQPTWSPDGKTIAFSTDRGPQTDFNTLKFSPLQLATYRPRDGPGHSVLPRSRTASTSTRSSRRTASDLFFISDQDGIPDIYRRASRERADLPASRTSRRASAASRRSRRRSRSSRKTGRMLFNVSTIRANEIRGLDASKTGRHARAARRRSPRARELPPPHVTRSLVMRLPRRCRRRSAVGQRFHGDGLSRRRSRSTRSASRASACRPADRSAPASPAACR